MCQLYTVLVLPRYWNPRLVLLSRAARFRKNEEGPPQTLDWETLERSKSGSQEQSNSKSKSKGRKEQEQEQLQLQLHGQKEARAGARHKNERQCTGQGSFLPPAAASELTLW
ncbi:hypothetical protein ColLi_05984 [Colletotrichum liriopes]|uniref:Uncharacterized protein n=1 Tax=Colletotrichum liriopes TaxID=708192 RepID=A0AA37GLB9_9PEZI|nr:hypothetical protein ColLi_05984 [Colletotrichum liriopes]